LLSIGLSSVTDEDELEEDKAELLEDEVKPLRAGSLEEIELPRFVSNGS
jgi:hypothetical protein